MNALPFVPKRGIYSPKGESAADATKDQSSPPILTVPNGLTIKCNPRIWQSISARASETDTSNHVQLKPKSLFTLSGVNLLSEFVSLFGSTINLFLAQAESKVNIQPLVRQVCSTPNVPRVGASTVRTDSSRERCSPSVKFELKQSRSYSNTPMTDDGLTDQSLQFNENNVVRLVHIG